MEEVFKELGRLEAEVRGLHRDKTEIKQDIKELKTDIDKKLEKIDNKLNELLEKKNNLVGGWKAYALLFGMLTASMSITKFIVELLK